MSQLTVWASFGLTKPNPAKSCLDTISIFSLELTSSEVSINVSGTPINWIYEQFSPLVHTYTRQAEDVRLPSLPTRYRNIINVGIQVWTEDHCVILQARPPQCEGWGLWSDLSEWQEAGERERGRDFATLEIRVTSGLHCTAIKHQLWDMCGTSGLCFVLDLRRLNGFASSRSVS